MTMTATRSAILTDHARQRCEEMDVSTKRAKRIVADPDLDRPARAGRRIAVREDDPLIAVVYVPGARPVIVTVVYRTTVTYQRPTTQEDT